ncbi:MAG: glycoside hydrolase family 127 protein [Phycisphaeraceae bacterium]|nr:glycoside hydrolase family 127 protein [Phycisphaeraceae bacterium]MCW5762184.1 glycoside hydrolase family 127 protein [Phycisphaeraceae bacterium]
MKSATTMIVMAASGAVLALPAWTQPEQSMAQYVTNREPLEPSRLVKLPIGSIEVGGWLGHQIRLQADGFHGRLGEISPFVQKEGNAWLDPKGRGDRGWEEVPYWLKGFLNAAYVLRDEAMIAEAHVWIEGAFASQQEDGWFGPDEGRTGLATRLTGRDDLWPNMIMLFCLMDYHDWTGDARVITLMQRYFRYLEQVPDDAFLIGYWPKIRAGDQLAAIHWLYNRTGEAWLLELAARTHQHTARWDEGVIDWHNVNVAQAFRQPAQWWVQSRDAKDKAQADANWRFVREQYGQVPGGMFGADENARPGFADPRQCIETCGIVEEMLSHEILIAITGDMIWADRCEDAAFNSLPAAFTADMGALRYLTAPNMAVSDAENHAPGIQNGGPMFLMSPHRHRCCQHNAGHGWPYLAQHLWYATPDGGLAAVFYAASTVTAKVAGGARVKIVQDTDYPFEQEIRFTVEAVEGANEGASEARFPLLLRIPGWNPGGDGGVMVLINGEREPVAAQAGHAGLVRLERVWKAGDSVRLILPMEVRVRRFAGNHNSAAIDRGPLTYALEIGEEYRRFDDAGAQNKELAEEAKPALNERWPAFEILPTTAWNMALVLEGPEAHFAIQEKSGRLNPSASPWTPASVPVAIEALVDPVSAWTLDRHGLVAPLQDSPVASDGEPRRARFIPMGAARLRLSALPVAATAGEGVVWSEPREQVRLYKATASHTYGSDDVGAMADGQGGAESGDAASDITAERHTFWPRRGTLEWVQADFDDVREIRSVSMFWFDDTGTGECRVPASWRVLTPEGDQWVAVATSDEFGVRRGTFNTVTFEPVRTRTVRVEIQLREGYSGGVVEMQID